MNEYEYNEYIYTEYIYTEIVLLPVIYSYKLTGFLPISTHYCDNVVDVQRML